MVLDTSHLNCSDLFQLNLTDDVKRASTYLVNPGSRAIALGIQILALVIGVPGNVSFLVSVARVAYMKTITNIFLINLAVADILFLVFTIFSYLMYLPAPVRSHIHSLLNLSCPVSFGIPFLTYFASVATICLLSAERYNAICRPLKHLAVNSKRRAVKLILGTWCVGLAFTSLAVLQYADPVRICVTWPSGNGTEKFADLPDIIGFCLPLAPWALVVGNLASSIPFMIALLGNAVMYVQIIRTLGKRHITETNGQEDMAHRARRVRNQVARMLVTNGTVFFICQVPYACINFVYIAGYFRGLEFLEVNDLQNSMRVFSHSLLFLNSAINPIIYYAMCPTYRRAVRVAFRSSTHSSVV
ncbi:growth hormone secretagogue receptor type 1-like [Acanthaster planci]|uniref:Growth hormone secretagogue receptor type 1-like n=1 Tax=Acanthaster planci TaxID=133434 RepID=A0A8B7YR32_ACAPL|nr:growth hormone secretagogue receptor type 1-like [Acanthaster planci]